MLKHSQKSVVAIPVKDAKGTPVKSDYFGAVGDDRLRTKDGVVYFKADGQ